jgi:hypothetical protein
LENPRRSSSGIPVIARLPHRSGSCQHSEAAGQLVLVGGPVHRIGGGAVVEQVAGVQRAPLPVRPSGAVGDDQIGVQQRIPRAARAVGEADRQQPRPLHMVGTMPPGARADLLIEVGDGGAHAGLVRLGDRRAGALITKGVEDRHVLVRAEHQIPRRHRIGPGRAAKLLTRPGVLPGEQPLERVR